MKGSGDATASSLRKDDTTEVEDKDAAEGDAAQQRKWYAWERFIGTFTFKS